VRTITYDRLTLTGVKNVRCSECSRKLRRQRTFGQTLNPFNKNAKGLPKTSQEIYTALRIEIAAWRLEPETCRNCRTRAKDGA
jgi:hypothetical protein